jgi:protein TonB
VRSSRTWNRDAIHKLLRAGLVAARAIKVSSGKETAPAVLPALELPTAQEILERGASVAETRSEDGATFEVTPPELIKKTIPSYPDAARNNRVQGTAILSATIDETGRVRDVEVTRKLTPDLNLSAVDAVCCWKYKPATRNGKPTPVFITVAVTYSTH